MVVPVRLKARPGQQSSGKAQRSVGATDGADGRGRPDDGGIRPEKEGRVDFER